MSETFNGAWENMPRIQVKRDIQQGVLLGDGLALRCRVEITTKASEGLVSTRKLDIWVEESIPASEYRLVMNGESVLMKYSRGSWCEITDHNPAKQRQIVA
jgi:hypothetical protein